MGVSGQLRILIALKIPCGISIAGGGVGCRIRSPDRGTGGNWMMSGNSLAALKISSPDTNAAKRTCYFCNGVYDDDTRFCPRDGTDLNYPPSIDEIAGELVHPKRWIVVVSLVVVLFIVCGFLAGMFNTGSSGSSESISVGGIAVRTTPAGAIVYLDGSRVGVTPMRLSDVPTGLHEVRVVFPGYSDGRANVEILPSATQKLVLDLTPLPQRRKINPLLAGLAVEAAPAIQLTKSDSAFYPN